MLALDAWLLHGPSKNSAHDWTAQLQVFRPLHFGQLVLAENAHLVPLIAIPAVLFVTQRRSYSLGASPLHYGHLLGAQHLRSHVGLCAGLRPALSPVNIQAHRLLLPGEAGGRAACKSCARACVQGLPQAVK